MTFLPQLPSRRLLAGALLAASAAFAPMPASASPGAHGPNGEHLDAAPAAVSLSASPRLEAHSEAFELVGKLEHGQFAFYVARYDSNEPVLNAQVEIELGERRTQAVFRVEQGDYLVADAAFTAALAAPGEHPLLFTLSVGDEGDLVDGSLKVAADQAGHAHDPAQAGGGLPPLAWGAGGVIALAAVAALGTLALRRRKPAFPTGGRA